MAGRVRKFPPRTCDEPGCGRVHIAQGRCQKHYGEWRASGAFTPADVSPHRIVETAADGLTGVCSQCGPVDIAMRLTKAGVRRPVCLNKARQDGHQKRKVIRESPERRAARNEYHARYARAVKYGMTIAELDELLAGDLGCAICSVELTPNSARLDHDHSCCAPTETRGCGDCLRGILCESCNFGLGFFRDDPERLRSAIDYLAKATAR